MSDVAYIMETQDPHELWLVEGENKFKVSNDMYWLLVSKGADLPPTHHITELLTENARLRELADGAANEADRLTHDAAALQIENAKLRALCADMVKMLVLACWASVESDEEASQCIYRAEALGIEVLS